ncbi:hypothetical protein K437DRAFT_254050 [Tilletiaria anomala UBC 951]|uniref:Uncharacterized protein n=1 Tax=Tilletiaria anomala (strain ATCC 24038 / CBS 436.72 / UBC 951) TaxID=1037660 RepID=A0A066WF89_TILAU|nr:uncharacterized protein K437DRAFT_254050 [Tilletiaria anomala UBC 951]KDN52647.1 hypothetical protein K437DRAFT_254050 [Tilletiaria anomala UBC 951]
MAISKIVARHHAPPGRAAFSQLACNVTSRRSLATISNVANPSGKVTFLEDHPAETHDQLPTFTLSRAHGFLPRRDPLPVLPERFGALDSLLQRMTIIQPGDRDGDKPSGLLATGDFGPAVHAELVHGAHGERLIKHVREVIASPKDAPGRMPLLSALFRDMCFLTSAYLLEPVDQSFRATGLYAPGRSVLPRAIAVPMCELADELGHFPYMEYSSSYALSNYRLNDPSLPTPAEIAAKQSRQAGANGAFGDELAIKTGPGRYSFENLELIRAFENAQGSEKGFIIVHCEMLAYSGRLVNATEGMLLAVAEQDVGTAESAMMRLLSTFEEVQESMESMWSRSLPSDYLKFRSFIYGTLGRPSQKHNAMFPDGVTYEGIGPRGESKQMEFRGESGANDSIIPMADNLLEITKELPDNELTRTLRDFRTYRPKTQREYLEHLESRASMLGVRAFCMSTSASPLLKALYILMVDQVREFRNRHWLFTRNYIIKQTDFSLATGGSNIIRYLPNNLATVLRVLEDSCAEWGAADEQALRTHARLTSSATGAQRAEVLVNKVREAGKRAEAQRRMLEREVALLMQEKAAKNPGIDESMRGMVMPPPTPKQAVNSVDAGQQRAYSTSVGNKDQNQEEKRSMKRGMVGCDGVG